MIQKIIATILGAFTGPLVDRIADVAKAYIGKQVSEAEFKAEVQKAVLSTFADIERAWLEAATAQFESFQQTVRSSEVVARAFAFVIVSQLIVLLWYQWGASAFLLATGEKWPSPGTTVEWAYFLVSIAIGGGAFTFRSASTNVLDKVGSLFVAKK